MEDNSWAEYRRMVIDWHTQDVIERLEIKTTLKAHQDLEEAKFEKIEASLAQLLYEHKTAKYFGGFVFPAFVALAVSWVSRKLGL